MSLNHQRVHYNLFVVVTLTVINAASVKLAARVQTLFTMAKLAALLIIIISGIVLMAMGKSLVTA